jgi:small nuclear ribonucleoprotein (snRNP)-like protein
MKKEDIGRRAVIIMSDNSTVLGTITEIDQTTNLFRVMDDRHTEYQFNESLVIIKFKSGA